MNLRPGIDTPPADHSIIAKLNIESDAQSAAIQVLQVIELSRKEKVLKERTHGVSRNENGCVTPNSVVSYFKLNLLVGFGLRFFLGELEQRTNEEVIPNFPPGGVFKPRKSTRFNMNKPVPLYLRTMNATGDQELLKRRLSKSGEISDQDLARAYEKWLSNCESDLILIVESNNRYLTIDLWDDIWKRLSKLDVKLVSLDEGTNRGDERDHTGYFDGISNLQHKIANEPQKYRHQIYLPHPAPSYPGEPTTNRDDPMYDGGTYMVHRKYAEDLDKWYADSFEVKTSKCPFRGFVARQHAVGRDYETGKVISRFDDSLLEQEPDSAEVNLGYNESHVLKARGGTMAPFSGPFPPLETGQVNVFETQDIRIKRRGSNFSEIDPSSGKVIYGLHFICFQNNIQQRGFEFINNIWLLNTNFRVNPDGLFNPAAGVIEPLSGCYYFVPPEHRQFAGDIFWE